jgi:hypothetical protein
MSKPFIGQGTAAVIEPRSKRGFLWAKPKPFIGQGKAAVITLNRGKRT